MNLGEEVILTLLWQSGASESATVCFVISLSICYWLFKCGVLCIVCVCVCEREREKERGLQRSVVCVCACVCESGRRGRITMAACVQSHTSIITVSVSWLCSPLGLELMVKPRTLLTVFTLILKAKAGDFGKGRYISDVACGVRPITMHWVNWPIRADCACRKEGLCRKRKQNEERRSIGDLQYCAVFEKFVFWTLKHANIFCYTKYTK